MAANEQNPGTSASPQAGDLVEAVDAAEGGPTSLITADESLKTACARWSAARVVGLDTEFVRERTYHPRPGLLQVADVNGPVMVDPLTISDFQPFAALLTNPAVTKIMHACDEDLDVLDVLTGVTPVGVFDTQLASAFLGYGFSTSYANLVEGLLDVVLDKGLTRSDWCHRPLTPGQLHYAALDVEYLSPIHARLSRELSTRGRMSWFEEELEHRHRVRTEAKQPESAYLRIRRRGALSPVHHAVLRALSHWREVEAMARNIPRRHLLTDEILMTLAQDSALDASKLEAIKGLSPRARARYGQAILTHVDAARRTGPSQIDIPVNLRPYSGTMVRLKEIAKEQADLLELPAELLASRRAIETLLISVVKRHREIPPEFQGWRFDVVTDALLGCIKSADKTGSDGGKAQSV